MLYDYSSTSYLTQTFRGPYGGHNSMWKFFGGVWPTGTRDMGFYSKSRHTHVYDTEIYYVTPIFTIRDPANFKITKIFPHSTGDPQELS